ncbi:Fur family transcriptional regulator [Janibacter sp. G56]|uniref:Fur family transcriptional regulator n=1 Tax=Janibacter sp. G56 TaxID=3418717 RepID=UPI003CFD83DF
MADVQTLVDRLRARGLRMTVQRGRVLSALDAAPHSTPEEVTRVVNEDGGTPLPPSTIYRALESLEECGIVAHTHLDHGAPTYHLADHAEHIHLVCRSCGAIRTCSVEVADDFTARVTDLTGFRSDLTHMAVHGLCADCPDPAHDGATDPMETSR